MKCPKCQYISFDNGEKCRNCGYEFSLSQLDDSPADTLSIHRDDEPVGPLGDLSLNDTPNLPLFEGRGDPDAPLVTAPAQPRAPLAVRRAAPAPPRPRQRRETPEPEPRLALDTADLTGTYGAAAAEPSEPAAAPATQIAGDVASVTARLGGGLIDLLLVGSIDLAIVYFTLRICDLTFAELSTLPIAPLVAFLLLLNGGYLSTFVAASGQTMGKMAVGTRVVPANPRVPAYDRVSFGQAVVRAAGYLVSALTAGLGFLPVLVSTDRRALHDRLADTRVVKA